jgi:sigma-B regulation protein RsbU (phosphoserine phosphatase)
MNGEALARPPLPDPVKVALDEFRKTFDLDVDLWTTQNGGGRVHLYPDEDAARDGRAPGVVVETVTPRDGPALELEVRARGKRGPKDETPEAVAAVLRSVLERTYDFAQEIRFFTYELSERYEEINLLYSISETLGSILRLDDAARVILGEVCDVLGALRGSLWVYDPERNVLHLTASVGPGGAVGPIPADDPDRVTAQVFREGRSMIVTRDGTGPEPGPEPEEPEPETFLSVPIRYTPPAGEVRTVGVINLIGRRHGGRFTASDQKLLSAIASQVGAALENNRLIQESLKQERVTHEMELAHNLQMKLLPVAEKFEGARVAARVQPAQSVGGDFYHLLKLPAGRIGVMVGDVSSHGFSAALIMALAISAATIYASEFGTPAKVLRHLDDALHQELETTEMYLTLFYAVLDPAKRRVLFANAGHPHAFIVHGDGTTTRLDATDPPVGIAGEESYGQSEIPWNPATDLLFCFTDGLSDSLDTAGKATGEQRVLDHVVELRDRTPAEIVESLFDLTSQPRRDIPSDDRTALVLRT